MTNKFVMYNQEKGIVLTKGGVIIKTFIHLGSFKLKFTSKVLKSEQEFDDFINDLIFERTFN